MPRKPAADVQIDGTLVTTLLAQWSDVRAALPVRKVAERWDCELWRMGRDLAVRIPRRAEASALTALHVPAPVDHPRNPARGVPLADRAAAVTDRLASLRTSATVSPALLDAAESAWRAGVAAPAWAGPPLWVHGDLHPGNLVIDGELLAGIIDFGDVTGGDPAYDLAIAWLAFDTAGRDAFRDAIGDRYVAATWTRARAWAAAVAVLLAAHSDHEPAYGALATEALHEVSSG